MGGNPNMVDMVFPPNHPILIGVSIIFTIHFGGFPPICGNIQICFLHHHKICRTSQEYPDTGTNSHTREGSEIRRSPVEKW